MKEKYTHKRERLIEEAFNLYSFEDYRLWAVDKMGELIQQMVRMRTPKCDKEELIRNALIVEDAICLLWRLMRKDEDMIGEIKEELYEDFDKMVREIRCCVISEDTHALPPLPHSMGAAEGSHPTTPAGVVKR